MFVVVEEVSEVEGSRFWVVGWKQNVANITRI